MEKNKASIFRRKMLFEIKKTIKSAKKFLSLTKNFNGYDFVACICFSYGFIKICKIACFIAFLRV